MKTKRIGIMTLAGILIFALAACDPKPLNLSEMQVEPDNVVNPKELINKRYRIHADQNVVYSSAQGINGVENLEMDVYYPTILPKKKRPVIVLVHGGGWATGGKRSPNPINYAPIFASTGYVVASIDYRLGSECIDANLSTKEVSSIRGLDPCDTHLGMAMADTASAVRWLRANASYYAIDTNNVFLVGLSAGGVTSLYNGVFNKVLDDSMLDPKDRSDISNFILGNAPANKSNPGYSSRINAWVGISSVMLPMTTDKASVLDEMRAEWPDYEPTPGLLLHGSEDTFVKPEWVTDKYNWLKDRGVDVDLRIYEGANHADSFNKDMKEEITLTIREFLYSKLN